MGSGARVCLGGLRAARGCRRLVCPLLCVYVLAFIVCLFVFCWGFLFCWCCAPPRACSLPLARCFSVCRVGQKNRAFVSPTPGPLALFWVWCWWRRSCCGSSFAFLTARPVLPPAAVTVKKTSPTFVLWRHRETKEAAGFNFQSETDADEVHARAGRAFPSSSSRFPLRYFPSFSR